MAKRAEVEQVREDLEEIVADTEGRRDEIWLNRMSMYLPSITSVIEIDDVTVEKIIDEFVAGIIRSERESNKPQLYGQKVVNII